jgi:hypothetical protein
MHGYSPGHRIVLAVALLVAVAPALSGARVPKFCKKAPDCRAAVVRCQDIGGGRPRVCKKLVRQRCKREGIEGCHAIYLPGPTSTTLPCPVARCSDGSCCSDPAYPHCTGIRGVCCAAGSPIHCDDKDGDGRGFCCPTDRPICGISSERCSAPPGGLYLSSVEGIRVANSDGARITLRVRILSSSETPASLSLSQGFFEAADEANTRYPAETPTDELQLPPGGVQECVVRFQMPGSVRSGVLHFSDGTYDDTEPFLFALTTTTSVPVPMGTTTSISTSTSSSTTTTAPPEIPVNVTGTWILQGGVAVNTCPFAPDAYFSGTLQLVEVAYRYPGCYLYLDLNGDPLCSLLGQLGGIYMEGFDENLGGFGVYSDTSVRQDGCSSRSTVFGDVWDDHRGEAHVQFYAQCPPLTECVVSYTVAMQRF